METVIIKVPIGKIEFTTDRAHGGEGDIEVLAQSIKAIGIIHPPAVKEISDNKGHYRIIAGRRRFAAAKSLGWKSLEVIVHPAKADEEAIALAENVNREDMHPLDEAEKFKREIDAGKTAEEVAKYYARSVSGIHQRVRLTKLVDGVKTMFRDGRINLSGAALIASLPEDDQAKFLKKYGEKKADKWEITNFIGTVQHLKIKHIADKKCEKCKNRTFNSTPGLFEDYSGIEDVCFDGECYANKWKNLIGKLIAEHGGNTDNKIILNRGIPGFLPPKTKVVTIGDTEYTLLSQSDHTWNETKKKSTANTAWCVSLDWFQSSGSYDVSVKRVDYKVYEKQKYTSYSDHENKDPVKTFMLNYLDMPPETRKDIGEKLQKIHKYPHGFFRTVRENLLETIIDKRLMLEDKEEKENMAALYLEWKLSDEDDEENKNQLDPEYQGLFDKVFNGNFKLSQLPKEPWVEKVFRILIAIEIGSSDIPALEDDEAEWKEHETSLFWRFAQMTKEEYIELHKKVLMEAITTELSKPETQEAEPQEDDEPAEDDEQGDEPLEDDPEMGDSLGDE
jgi:ParB/RepB/Spo0J family partition protein